MEDVFVYKLKFTGPLHLGQEGIGLEKTDEIVRSDTLFSAILSCWSLFYDDDLDELIKETPFILSSCFPFKGDDYFFPRPMVKIGKRGEDDPKIGKKIKKVRFISQGLLENILDGKEVPFSEENTLQNGIIWTERSYKNVLEEEKFVYKKREVPRVTIDRAANTSEIFYFNELVFSEDSGLFFLVRFLDPQIKSKLEAVLRLLGDEGIGGDKHLGRGCFEIEAIDSFEIKLPQDTGHFLTLSLFHPTEDEAAKGLIKEASYDLIARRGWIHSKGAMALKRKGIRMFTEGSIFKEVGKEIYGNIPIVLEKNMDLGLRHNIYRNGLAFTFPIKAGEDNE